MIASILLRFARKVVEGVLSQLGGLINQVTEQALNPMNQMVQAVTGGVWVGKGADAFVEEVQGLMMPGTTQITETIGIFSKNISNAVDVIDQADSMVNNAVNGLADVFGSIF
ncbi:MAG: WXG100 family type VII secretion target [Ardenticatenaceae bacterium]|nr:WXG100 family type VII secretion target [Ardenticatenaceae bacterium]